MTQVHRRVLPAVSRPGTVVRCRPSWGAALISGHPGGPSAWASHRGEYPPAGA